MSTITSVESQKKNPKRFNIFLDGQFAFGADEDLIVDYRLIVGKTLESSDVEKLLFEAEVGKLVERIYGLLNVRARSEKEIRDYLKRLSFKRKIKGKEEVSEQATELLIKKIKQKGLIDDKGFAKAWMESRLRKKGMRVIAQELYQKGIDKEIIEEITSENNLTLEEQTANKLLERKMRSWSKLQEKEFRKKAYDFLLRRGFNYSMVKEVVEGFVKKGYN